MVILSISSVVCCELNFHSRVHTSALYYIPLWVYVQWSGKHETTTSKNRNNNTNIFTQANKKFLIHPVFLLHISIIFSLTLFRGIFYFVFLFDILSRWTRTRIPNSIRWIKFNSVINHSVCHYRVVDYNNLTQSSNSIRSKPEVDCCYENLEAEPTAPDLETIVSPVYATEEYLPRCSIIVEDYANTFHSVEFLDCDQPTAFTDLNFNE